MNANVDIFHTDIDGISLFRRLIFLSLSLGHISATIVPQMSFQSMIGQPWQTRVMCNFSQMQMSAICDHTVFSPEIQGC